MLSTLLGLVTGESVIKWYIIIGAIVLLFSVFGYLFYSNLHLQSENSALLLSEEHLSIQVSLKDRSIQKLEQIVKDNKALVDSYLKKDKYIRGLYNEEKKEFKKFREQLKKAKGNSNSKFTNSFNQLLHKFTSATSSD